MIPNQTYLRRLLSSRHKLSCSKPSATDKLVKSIDVYISSLTPMVVENVIEIEWIQPRFSFIAASMNTVAAYLFVKGGYVTLHLIRYRVSRNRFFL